MDASFNIITGGETRITTHGLSIALGYYAFFQYVSSNGQNDWVKVYNQVAFSQVNNIALNQGISKATRAIALVKNPTTQIMHFLFINTADGTLLNSLQDDTVANSYYWTDSYVNSVLLDSTILVHQLHQTYLNGNMIIKELLHLLIPEYFPTIQKMNASTGILQYAYSLNITRTQTIDATVDFYQIQADLKCSDTRILSNNSYFVLVIDVTLQKNYLYRLYDLTSTGGSMTQQEFYYKTNYRINDALIASDFTVYYCGSILYSALSSAKYYSFIMPQDITQSCASNNLQPIFTQSTLITTSEFKFQNLGVVLQSTTNIILKKNSTLQLLSQNISLYSTNYTNFCDPIPKLQTYNNQTSISEKYPIQGNSYAKNISQSFFFGDESCKDKSRKLSVNSRQQTNLPFLFDGKDQLTISQSLFIETQSTYELTCTYPSGQAASMNLSIEFVDCTVQVNLDQFSNVYYNIGDNVRTLNLSSYDLDPACPIVQEIVMNISPPPAKETTFLQTLDNTLKIFETDTDAKGVYQIDLAYISSYQGYQYQTDFSFFVNIICPLKSFTHTFNGQLEYNYTVGSGKFLIQGQHINCYNSNLDYNINNYIITNYIISNYIITNYNITNYIIIDNYIINNYIINIYIISNYIINNYIINNYIINNYNINHFNNQGYYNQYYYYIRQHNYNSNPINNSKTNYNYFNHHEVFNNYNFLDNNCQANNN
ncbi:UNKNOWN [Stylonychia lemnae]|uniref:Uncharacterized protein n=1 Tax=Stylonychia lemnae TaxID=5949 RepID=A0A078AD69_STYLE|nr:UNKNOWN [Stylonychia lemnae]|eukprot:CDW79786.1 UNKNOWN [Stylonychia lemnae]